MKQIIAAVALLILVLPPAVEAQWRNWSDEDMERWQNYWRSTDEGGEVDEDDIREWRTRNSKLQESIDDLDNDPVKKMAIPILFGVTVSDLAPNFGDPRDGGGRTHEGLDIMAPEGTPIVSPTEAVVVRTGEGESSGEYVVTANPGDESFVYMHLDAIADIEAGDELEVGDLIGYVGNTGNASGGPAHLHLEIREDRKASDPLPRLTKEFSLADKIEYLEAILKDHDDEDEFIEFLMDEYVAVFVQAQTVGIDLPEELAKQLPDIPVRDLTLGSSGADVSQLQSILIAKGYLDIAMPTGYFGTFTADAVASYQRSAGISPANGYYGPVTRSKLARAETSNVEEPTLSAAERAAILAQISELMKLIAELQAQLAARQS